MWHSVREMHPMPQWGYPLPDLHVVTSDTRPLPGRDLGLIAA